MCILQRFREHRDTMQINYKGDDILGMDDLPAEEDCRIYTYYSDEEKNRMISICDSVYAKLMK